MKFYNQLTGKVEECASKADLERLEAKLKDCTTETKVVRLIQDALYSKPQMVALIKEILATEVEGYQALEAKIEYRMSSLDDFIVKFVLDKLKVEVEQFINNIVKQSSPNPEQKVTGVEKNT